MKCKVRENCHFLDHPPTPMSLRNIKMAHNTYLFWHFSTVRKNCMCQRSVSFERAFRFFQFPQIYAPVGYLCSSRLGQKLTLSSSFFGRIEDTKIPYEINWPLNKDFMPLIIISKNVEVMCRLYQILTKFLYLNE